MDNFITRLLFLVGNSIMLAKPRKPEVIGFTFCISSKL